MGSNMLTFNVSKESVRERLSSNRLDRERGDEILT
jgi:hypothetical protein